MCPSLGQPQPSCAFLNFRLNSMRTAVDPNDDPQPPPAGLALPLDLVPTSVGMIDDPIRSRDGRIHSLAVDTPFRQHAQEMRRRLHSFTLAWMPRAGPSRPGKRVGIRFVGRLVSREDAGLFCAERRTCSDAHVPRVSVAAAPSPASSIASAYPQSGSAPRARGARGICALTRMTPRTRSCWGL